MLASVVVAGTLVAAVPAAASATGCDDGGVHHGNRKGDTCLHVEGSGAHIDYTTTWHHDDGVLVICDYRAWNKWRVSASSERTRTSSTVFSCVEGWAIVRMNFNMNVAHPSYMYAQFYHGPQDGWVNDYPRVLITS